MSKNTVITIARQFASGGREIGKLVSETLKVPFFDKELISMAAKESGFSEEVFQKVDEKATNSFLYSLVMGSYSATPNFSTAQTMPLNDKLFLIQSDIIKKAAQEGPCVIVGRCADYVLRDFKNCLRVFIRADKPFRIARAVGIYGINADKAPDVLAKRDKQRASYYNFYTNNKWDSLSHYDLVVNSSLLGLEKTAQLIVGAAETL